MLTGLKNKRLPAVFFLLLTAAVCVFGLLAQSGTDAKNSNVQASKLNAYYSYCSKLENEYEHFLQSNNPLKGVFNGICPCCGLPIGCNGSGGVYLCNDGYLVNKPVEYRDRFRKNIDIIIKFAELANAEVSVMLVPQPGYILENKLPQPHMQYDDGKLIKEAENRFCDTHINFVRVDDILKKCADNNRQVYYKTDHHWTSAGAYAAYCRFCDVNGLTATSECDFSVKKYGGFLGSIYLRKSVKCVPPDEIEIWKSLKSLSNISVEIEEGENTVKSETAFFMTHIDDGDKYSVFLDGNHSFVRIKNAASNGGRLLIIRDSFAQVFAPFLADNYSEIILLDMRYYKHSVLKLINDEAINEVLFLYSFGVFAKDTDIAWCVRE